MLKLAKAIDKVAIKYDVDIIVTPNIPIFPCRRRIPSVFGCLPSIWIPCPSVAAWVRFSRSGQGGRRGGLFAKGRCDGHGIPRWQEKRADSDYGHLRSVFLVRSESITIKDGLLDTGEFAHIYFIDWDHVRARRRQLNVTVIGTPEDVGDHKWNNGKVINTLRKYTPEEKAYDEHYDLQLKR